jgi:hypothetical protein
MKTFLHSFRSEWLKTRHTAASWLVIIGGFFMPVIFTLIQIIKPNSFSTLVFGAEFWNVILVRAWEFTSILLMPFGVILATSLIAQIEFKNNAWKQVCTTPQSMTTIFSAKLMVIVMMLAQFFVYFNLGLWLSPYVAAFFNHSLPLPDTILPPMKYAADAWAFFITYLPIVALQYLVSLRFGNFLISIGTGLGLVIMSIFLFKWEYGYTVPYTYNLYHFLIMSGQGAGPKDVNIYALSFIFFFALSSIALISFIFKKQRG